MYICTHIYLDITQTDMYKSLCVHVCIIFHYCHISYLERIVLEPRSLFFALLRFYRLLWQFDLKGKHSMSCVIVSLNTSHNIVNGLL